MSESRAWSWRSPIASSDLSPTTRHVLLTVSLHMNEHGAGCYRSQETLADETGLSRKTVNEHIGKAVDAGWLSVEQHGYRRRKWRRNEYVASWPERGLDGTVEPPRGRNAGLQPHADEVVTLTEEGCNSDGNEVVTEGYTNPPKNPPLNPPPRDARARKSDPDRDGGKKIDEGEQAERQLTGKQRGDLIDRIVNAYPPGCGRVKEGIKALEALSDDDLADCAAKLPLWLEQRRGAGRKLDPALSVFVKDRLWEEAREPDEAPEPTMRRVQRGERLWNASFYRIVLIDDMAVLPEPPIDVLRRLIKSGGKAGEAAKRNLMVNHGWPAATQMCRDDVAGLGTSVPLELERLAERFGSVKAGSALWQAWKDHHSAMGWPFADRHTGGAWLPVPSNPDAYEGDEAGFVAAALAELKTALEAMSGGNEESSDDDCVA